MTTFRLYTAADWIIYGVMMDKQSPVQTWYFENPADNILHALKVAFKKLLVNGANISEDERLDTFGSWPYVDEIHVHIFTIQYKSGIAVVEWGNGRNDGAMETWTTLSIKLYGHDPLLETTINTLIDQHLNS